MIVHTHKYLNICVCVDVFVCGNQIQTGTGRPVRDTRIEKESLVCQENPRLARSKKKVSFSGYSFLIQATIGSCWASGRRYWSTVRQIMAVWNMYVPRSWQCLSSCTFSKWPSSVLYQHDTYNGQEREIRKKDLGSPSWRHLGCVPSRGLLDVPGVFICQCEAVGQLTR